MSNKKPAGEPAQEPVVEAPIPKPKKRAKKNSEETSPIVSDDSKRKPVVLPEEFDKLFHSAFSWISVLAEAGRDGDLELIETVGSPEGSDWRHTYAVANRIATLNKATNHLKSIGASYQVFKDTEKIFTDSISYFIATDYGHEDMEALYLRSQVEFAKEEAERSQKEEESLIPVNIHLSITHEDFEMLTEMAMSWDPEFREQLEDGRFEESPVRGKPRGTDWKYIYWVGLNYSNVLIARAFIEAKGYGYQVLWDMVEHDNGDLFGWAIATDYGDEGMEHMHQHHMMHQAEHKELDDKFQAIMKGSGLGGSEENLNLDKESDEESETN